MTHVAHLTLEQENSLVKRAQAGERQAREAILESLMDHITYLARQYTRRYAWAKPRIEYDDLVSVGTLSVWEKMEHALEHAACPFAYFVTTLERAMVHYCFQFCSPVQAEGTIVPVTSMDRPRGQEDDSTLYDEIAAPPLAGTSAQQQDYMPLYQAIEALPEKEQLAIFASFQLEAHVLDSHPGWEMARTTNWYFRARALTTLRQTLASAYAPYASEYIPPRKGTCSYAALQISSSQRQRLDQAYAALQAQGQRPTTRKLGRLAGVGTHTANAYLNEHGLIERAAGLQQRKLDEAYARLLANGEHLTLERLRQAAGVGWGYASAYLRQKNQALAAR